LRRQEVKCLNPATCQKRTLFIQTINQARKLLSTLVHVRFGHLVEDIVSEVKRRYPHLLYSASAEGNSTYFLSQLSVEWSYVSLI
jgi:hypothetical protein